MGRPVIHLLIWLFLSACNCLAGSDDTEYFLFLGHPRAEDPWLPTAMRIVESVDYSLYDMILLGGDLMFNTSLSETTAGYAERVWNISSPSTLFALGNHDTFGDTAVITNITGRPRYYAYKTNTVQFLVLDTEEAGGQIVGNQLNLIATVAATIDAGTCSHLVVVHHRILWMHGNPVLEPYVPTVGNSTQVSPDTNWNDVVQPLLEFVQSRGVQVICIAGDRTPFSIGHITTGGVVLLAHGMSFLRQDGNHVFLFTYRPSTRELTGQFISATLLPRRADSPIAINEIHYQPGPSQGPSNAFVELANQGDQPVDLSGAYFYGGALFQFPPGVEIAPGEHVVVAAQTNLHAGAGYQVFEWAHGDLPFPGPIQLRDKYSVELDYVDVGAALPWPTEPNGGGPTLSLIQSGLDNEEFTPWRPSDQAGGTPGAENFPGAQAVDIGYGPGGVDLDWLAVSGAVYRLEGIDDPERPSWTPIGGDHHATSTVIRMTDPDGASADMRMYRALRVFP